MSKGQVFMMDLMLSSLLIVSALFFLPRFYGHSSSTLRYVCYDIMEGIYEDDFLKKGIEDLFLGNTTSLEKRLEWYANALRVGGIEIMVGGRTAMVGDEGEEYESCYLPLFVEGRVMECRVKVWE